MTDQDRNRFEDELIELRKRLEELGRPLSSLGMVDGASGMTNNLSSPYARPRELRGESWNQTEKNA